MFRAASIGVVLALVLAACGPEEDDAAALEERVTVLEADLDAARAEADELRTENDRLEEELAALQEDDPEDPEAPDEQDPTPDVGAPQPEHTPEGLNEQLRMLFGFGDVPDEFEPGTTEWSGRDQPEGLEDAYPSSGALAFDLAAALDAEALGPEQWETTTRVLHDEDDPDQAYVAVLSWGFLDDAVAGRDVRMTITRTDAGWEPGGVEERHHCRRGVDGDLCV